MKIAHYCRVFSPLSETFIYDVVLALEEEKNINNIVITHSHINQSQRPYEHVVLVHEKKLSFVSKLYKYLLRRKAVGLAIDFEWKFKRRSLLELLKEQKPDVIHAHFGPQGCIIHPIALALNIPLVVSFHGFDAFQLPNDKYWLQQMKSLFLSAAKITVVSSFMQNQLVTLGCPVDKIEVVHVGKVISDYRFKNRSNVKTHNFISIGRLVEKKGHLDCVKAFNNLIQKHPQLTLKIIGEGPLFEPLKNFIYSNGLEANIKLLGPVDHVLTKQYLSEADAFILCSKIADNGDMEGIPTVLMEAQAMGLPCISTKHSGIPEVFVTESQMYLAEEGNVQEIETAVERLLGTSSITLNTLIVKGRKKIENEFNLKKENSKLIALYESILMQP